MDTVADTFPAAFLAALDPLRLRARSVPAGGRFASQRARSKGAGIEFADVRPYVPGDDLRALDGAAWLRLDRLFTRLFVQEEDLPVHILVDRSSSLGLVAAEDGMTKRRAALQVAAAFAWISLKRLDRVTVRGFSGGVATPLPSVNGPSAFPRLLDQLVALPDGGETDVRGACADLAARGGRRGLCILVSDFLDPRGIDAVADGLALLKHKTALIRLVRPGEERPDLRGDLDLEDVESGARLGVDADPGFADRYEAAWRAYGDGLATVAARYGAVLHTVNLGTPVPESLAGLFAHGAFPG